MSVLSGLLYVAYSSVTVPHALASFIYEEKRTLRSRGAPPYRGNMEVGIYRLSRLGPSYDTLLVLWWCTEPYSLCSGFRFVSISSQALLSVQCRNVGG